MAQIRCNGCGKEVSDQASACPSCGYPMHLDKFRMSGEPPLSQPVANPKPIEKSSAKGIMKVSMITVGIFVVLIVGFLYSFRIPAANALIQKMLDSYSSEGIIQTIANIPSFIAGGDVQVQNNGIATNQQRPVQVPPPQQGVSASKAVGGGNGSGQQKTNISPQVVAQKPATSITSYFTPNPQETCSQQAADWVNKENNGNPNGTTGGSGENGVMVFQGNIKTTLYKTFSSPSTPCLFAEYTVWTQATGGVWEQQINVANVTNPNEPVWMQYIQPAISNAAMLQQLDSEVSLLSQSSAPVAAGSVSQQTTPPQGNIAEQSLVALLCHYSDGSESRGSGVIVDSQGYILTAKHIVDPAWTSWAYGTSPSDATLNNCEVGVPPVASLPSAQEIEQFGSSVAVSQPFPFRATLSFEPSQGQLSDNEYKQLDFAILKISSPLDNCAAYNACTLPTAYPYSPVYYASEPNTASLNQVFNFGYPYEVATSSASANFSNFNLKGAVGRLTQYYGGDQYFKNQPFDFSWSAIDVLPGRSGSPIFWDGYVIGVEDSGQAGNVTNDYAIGLPAVEQILSNNGLGNILSTN